MITTTWAVTGALWGLAGTVFAIDIGSFEPSSTDMFVVLILAAVFLGGPGHAYAAMLGALVIGLFTEISAAYIQPDYKYAIAFVSYSSCSPCGRLACSAPGRNQGREPMYYLIILLVYAAVDAIACLGLSQQFGVAGVTNFGFIIFQAAGAYIAAILSLPPRYRERGGPALSRRLAAAIPAPLVGAAAAASGSRVPFTFLVGRRLRGDFAAVGLLVTAVLLNLLVMDYRPLFNGDAGRASCPRR